VAALAESTSLAQPAAIRPNRRHVWLWWTIGGVALVAVASAGVFLWLSHQAQRQAVAAAQAAQAEAWQAATSRVETLGLPTESEVGAEGTYFIIRSAYPGGPCTAAEVEDFWRANFGFVPSDAFSLLNGPGYCNENKQRDFARSVTFALDDTTDVFEALGVSEAAVGQLKSMRGLDGSQVRTETGTAAGDLTITFQYDGLNGVQVRVERTPGP
jgi:cytoskeletal protein RodZ